MPKLELNTKYELNLTGKVQLGAIKPQVLYERLTDGRISGLLAEDLVRATYTNLEKVDNKSAGFDLRDRAERKYECRTLNDGGASLIPSNQKGKGRKYSRGPHLAMLKALYAFVFIDVRKSPLFYITAIPTSDLGERKHLSPTQFGNMTGAFKQVKI